MGWMVRAGFVSFVTIMLVGCQGADEPLSALKEEWTFANDPSFFKVDANEKTYRELPTAGRIDADGKLWSGSYWPLVLGGLANRWRAPGFHFQTASRRGFEDFLVFDLQSGRQVRELSLDYLSPIEKYDLIVGDGQFGATRAEFAKATGKNWEPWTGYCHGWALATIRHKEPLLDVVGDAIDVTVGRLGRKMKLFRDDIKAILTKYYGDLIAVAEGGDHGPSKLGLQCVLSSLELGDKRNADVYDQANGRLKVTSCDDINPGSMHLILSAFLGGSSRSVTKQPIIVDAAKDSQIYNHPVVAFRFRELSPIANLPRRGLKNNTECQRRLAQDGLKNYRGIGGGDTNVACLIYVEAHVSYVNLSSPGTRSGLTDMPLAYSLELDDDGYIRGGEWATDLNRPEWRELDRSFVFNATRPDIFWLPETSSRERLTDADSPVIKLDRFKAALGREI